MSEIAEFTYRSAKSALRLYFEPLRWVGGLFRRAGDVSKVKASAPISAGAPTQMRKPNVSEPVSSYMVRKSRIETAYEETVQDVASATEGFEKQEELLEELEYLHERLSREEEVVKLRLAKQFALVTITLYVILVVCVFIFFKDLREVVILSFAMGLYGVIHLIFGYYFVYKGSKREVFFDAHPHQEGIDLKKPLSPARRRRGRR